MRFVFFSILLLSNVGNLHCQLLFEDSSVLYNANVSYGTSYFGGGVSFVDFDGDGWDDITFSSTEGKIYTF